MPRTLAASLAALLILGVGAVTIGAAGGSEPDASAHHVGRTPGRPYHAPPLASHGFGVQMAQYDRAVKLVTAVRFVEATSAAEAVAAAQAAAAYAAAASRHRSGVRRGGGGGGGCGSDFECFKACTLGHESGGNYAAVSSGGTYRGAWQFDQQTWNTNGGVGDPAAASQAQQDAVARATWQARGNQPWGGRC